MDDTDKLIIHRLVARLFVYGPPLLNQLLTPVGIKITTGNDSADKCADLVVMGIGLGYSIWTNYKAKQVHTDQGKIEGIAAVVAVDASIAQSSSPAKIDPTSPVAPQITHP